MVLTEDFEDSVEGVERETRVILYGELADISDMVLVGGNDLVRAISAAIR